MDIPIEIFMTGIGVSIALAVFGFMRNPQIPAMLVFGGMFILSFSVMTDNLIFGSRVDNIVATENTFNITTSIVRIPEYSYNQLRGETVGPIDNGGTNRNARVEFASTGSSLLVGDTISCINVPIQDTGTASTGIIETGTFGGNGLIVKSFGTRDLSVNPITSSVVFYEFCLPDDEEYTIQSGDRIGIRYAFDTTGNGIATRVSDTDAFDTTVTTHQAYIVSWTNFVTSDQMMQLYKYEEFPTSVPVSGIGGAYTYEQDDFPFTEMEKVLFALIGVTMMLCGAIMVGRNQ